MTSVHEARIEVGTENGWPAPAQANGTTDKDPGAGGWPVSPTQGDAEVALAIFDRIDVEAVVADVVESIGHERVPIGGFGMSRQERSARFTIQMIREQLQAQIEGGADGTSSEE